MTDINPVVRAYEVSESNYEGSYVFRTKNKYICHYKNPDSQTIKISTSKFNFINPSNDPYSGGRLYKITDDNIKVLKKISEIEIQMNEILTEIKKTSAFKNYYILSSIFSQILSLLILLILFRHLLLNIKK